MPSSLAERMKKARTAAGFTQDEAAKLLEVAELTLNRYEKGHRIPDVDFAKKLSKLYKCDPGWIVAGDDLEGKKPKEERKRELTKSEAKNIENCLKAYQKDSNLTEDEFIAKVSIPEDTFVDLLAGNGKRISKSWARELDAYIGRYTDLRLSSYFVRTRDGYYRKSHTVPVLQSMSVDFANLLAEEVIGQLCLPDVPANAFATVMAGDSMRPAINDGDVVVFVREKEAKNGDLVVAKFENEFEPVVRRSFRTGTHLELRTDDDAEYASYSSKDFSFKVIGKVVKIWREVSQKVRK
jgi:SOS-response transcriptional repressor LexA/DNA-binding XRE family transcriptional regulator